ncbi:MAG: hypothetical protein R6U95_01755 [Bacteroidales bacterium]
MKKTLCILCIVTVLYSCNKENNQPENSKENSYDLPWKTEFITYENTWLCNGSHSNGYKLYYKDSLLKEECYEFGGITIEDSLLVNDSILHLFFNSSKGGSSVLSTSDGGYTWSNYPTGPPELLRFHFVDTELTYCITQVGDDVFVTGIGKSSVSMYEDSLRSGTHYIQDVGTEVADKDSTVIQINDSINFILLFKEL